MVKAQYSKPGKSNRSKNGKSAQQQLRRQSVTSVDMDGLIQMDQTPQPQDTGPPASDGHMLVGIDEIQFLRAQGIEIPLPCNGPDNGPPQYAIPISEYRNMQATLNQRGSSEDDMIDPLLRTGENAIAGPSATANQDRHSLTRQQATDADAGQRPRPRPKAKAPKQTADTLAALEAQTMAVTGARTLKASFKLNVK